MQGIIPAAFIHHKHEYLHNASQHPPVLQLPQHEYNQVTLICYSQLTIPHHNGSTVARPAAGALSGLGNAAPEV